jgi:hypothetical protein
MSTISAPDPKSLEQRIISVSLTHSSSSTKMKDFTPVRVYDNPSNGRLECKYHVGSLLCDCIRLVMTHQLDASLMGVHNRVMVPFGLESDILLRGEFGVDLAERGPGGSRLALCSVARDPRSGVQGDLTIRLGYHMPHEGRFALLQSFMVSCGDYSELLKRTQSTAGVSPCGDALHNYKSEEKMQFNFRSVSRGTIEAAFLLAKGTCTNCYIASFTSDAVVLPS